MRGLHSHPGRPLVLSRLRWLSSKSTLTQNLPLAARCRASRWFLRLRVRVCPLGPTLGLQEGGPGETNHTLSTSLLDVPGTLRLWALVLVLPLHPPEPVPSWSPGLWDLFLDWPPDTSAEGRSRGFLRAQHRVNEGR